MKRISLVLVLVSATFSVLHAQKTDTLTTASGIKYFLTKQGKGRLLKNNEVAIWHYTLTLPDGTRLDDSRERKSPLGEKIPSERMIKGVSEVLLMLHVGDRGIFILPPALGYGQREMVGQGALPGIPANSTLVFDMELVDIKQGSLSELLENALYKKPISDTATPRVAEMLALYAELKKKKFMDLYRSDNDLNSIGYELLERYPEDALKVFKLNAAEYPNVSNVFDSLGEGYMKTNDFDNAILNYQKSIDLDPKNTNAVEMIKGMKAKRAKAVNTM
jgi:hypothetical protein